ncbi:MAG TPA: acyltransferase family protein [Polyangiaceae bacterium]|nr:acyltransferase family protein [Polyangiaceae bacterium]
MDSKRALSNGTFRAVNSPAHPARLRHVPALDGLRGLALVGVLLFHANGALAGGYLGVDLFFVLSGYLITSLLLAEHRETGRIALGPFWIRRARRLFPALLSLMPVVAIYGRYFARQDELLTVRAQALAALAYVANWQAIFRHQSYWQLFAAPSPLEHTWSLSIEEQFYVLWPLLVSLVLRRRGTRTLLGVCLVLSASSMAAMWFVFDPGNTTRAYLGTDTRMAGILFGAALATLISPNDHFGVRTVRALDAFGLLAVLGLGFAWATLRGTNPFLYHGGFWLTELAALLLIACAIAGERSLVARALAVRPLTWLGTISYGVYLWHWPVNVFLSTERTHLHGFGLHAVRFVLTFAIAIVSYRFLEQPIRKHGVPFNRPLYIVPGAVALSVFLVVHATYAEGRREPPAHSAQLPSVGSPPEFVRFRVAVFGDSTANSLGWSLRNLHGQGVAVELLGKDGCNMLEDTCEGSRWVEQVRSLQPNASIVYLAGVFLYGFHVKDDWYTACRSDWDDKLGRVLVLRLAELAHEGGIVFTATAPYPVGPYENDSNDRREFHQRVDCINAVIRKSAAAVPGVRVLDIGAQLCPGGVCQQDIGASEPIRPDGVHFSIDASKGLAHWVYEELRR